MSNISLAELLITDGTKVVDLLNHFRLLSWQPVETPIRDGGIFQESPMSDGRRMVSKYHANGGETFALAVRTGHQNSAIADLRRLRGMFEQAANYWINPWSGGMVWIEARSGQESNRRYALIMNGNVPVDPAPYSEPFAGRLQTIGIIQVGVERGHWQDVQPGTDSDLAISGNIWEESVNLDGGGGDICVYFQRGSSAETTGDDVFVSPGRNTENNVLGIYINITDPIASPPPIGDVIDTATDYYLFENLDEYTYILCGPDFCFSSWLFSYSSRNQDSPLTNLVFDIASAASANAEYVWEYYSSSTSSWVVINASDYYFDGFSSTGKSVFSLSDSFAIEYLADATDATDPGISAWYFRVKQTVGVTMPKQKGGVRVHSVTWNHIEIPSENVFGDIDALTRINIKNRAIELVAGDPLITEDDEFSLTSAPEKTSIYVGLRSVDRGSDFQINQYFIPAGGLETTYQPVTTIGANATFVSSWKQSYYGDDLGFSMQATYATATLGMAMYGIAFDGGKAEGLVATMDYSPAAKNTYRGEYLCFLLCQMQDEPITGSANFYVQIKLYDSYYDTYDASLYPGAMLWETEKRPVYDNQTTSFTAVNMGIIKFPNDIREDETYGNHLYLNIYCTYSDAVQTSYASPSVEDNPKLFIDRVVLIPADEWLGIASLAPQNVLSIDSTTDPKKEIRAVAIREQSGYPEYIYGTGKIVSNGPAILHTNTTQRLWFFNTKSYVGTNRGVGGNTKLGVYNELNQVYSITMGSVNRYKSMRGDS